MSNRSSRRCAATGLALALAVLATPNASAQAADAHHHAHDHAGEPARDLSHEGRHDASRPMTGALGPHPMTREASGTAWQPEATPMQGWHGTASDWSWMAHGFVNLVHDRQTGPRGGSKTFTQSMFMLMGQREAGPGTLGLRAMLSLDPTMGRRGYPLLFQTGETADGTTALVDRQHPHDLFMELAGTYSVRLGGAGAAFAYLGLPGEPALGPPAFMHRFSGMRNPEAPLTHHWLDSTHITFGVATLGVSQGPWQLEGSWFNGREPDQHRWNLEVRRFDSWSARLTWNPLPSLSMQVSQGKLKSPEQLEPDVRVERTTASATWHLDRDDLQWATTLAWGRNRKSGPGLRTAGTGWLLESSLELRRTHTFFARAEQVENGELFPGEHGGHHGDAYRIRKLSLGYIHDFARTGPVSWGVGGLVGRGYAPAALDAHYGRRPTSVMVFLQGRV